MAGLSFVGWFCSYHQGGLSLIAGQGAACPGAGGGVEAAAANAKVEELLLIAVVLRERGGERGVSGEQR